MNALQLSRFGEMTDGIGVPRSFSATGGILLGRDYHFDLTRPGVGLYGGLPFEDARPVLRLSLPVVQVRDLAPGETVGYANTWAAPARTRLATVSGGYADGLFRTLSSRATVYAGDTPCPVVGRVSMDLITVDITHLDEDPRRSNSSAPTRASTASPTPRAPSATRSSPRSETATGGATPGAGHEPPRGARAAGPRASRARRAHRDLCAARRSATWSARPSTPKELLQQIWFIGYLSLPVVGLTALFTGGALALQIYAGGARFNAESVVPSIVAIGMVRELGPVLGGLMVAGRVAASIAAEIGTMKVTEQIDALVTLSTNPMKYLTVPRVVAAVLTVPVLVAIGDVIGIMGGFLVGVTRLDFNAAAYMSNTLDFLETFDVVSGLVKAAVFGFIVALMGCYHGMNSGRGAQGVGRATTNAVVSASIMILAVQLRADGGVLLRMIELKGVTKSFGPKEVLRGIDLSVATGHEHGHHRRLRHRKVRPSQVHPRPRST